MRRKILIPLILIWVFFMGGMFLLHMNYVEKQDVENAYVGGAVMGKDTYCIDKRYSSSFLMRIAPNKKVTAAISAKAFEYDEFEYVVGGDECIAVLLSRDNPYSAGDGKTYQLAVLSSKLSLLYYSTYFTFPNSETFSSMTREGDIYYLVSVESDGSAVHLYEMNKKELTDVSDPKEDSSDASEENIKDKDRIDSENENAVSISDSYTLTTENDRLFAEGYYSNGTMYAWEDDEEPYSGFLENSEYESIYKKADMPLKELISRHPHLIACYIALTIAVLIVMLSFLILGKARDRYSVVIATVLLLAIVLTGCFAVVYLRIDSVMENRESELLEGVANDFSKSVYSSALSAESKDKLYSSDAYKIVREEADLSVTDVLLIKVDSTDKSFDGEIILSKTSHNYAPLDELYGEGIEKIANKTYNYGEAEGTFKHKNKDYIMNGISLVKEYGIPYIVVVVDEHSYIRGVNLISVIIPFVVVYILMVSIIAFREMIGRRNLKRLARGMVEVSDDAREVKVPAFIPQSLKLHWEALGEIEKRIKRINYSAYQTYKAYYRFAPKKIESILGKESIMEVRAGDAIRFKGTQGLITFSKKFQRSRNGIERMNQLIELMEKHRNENNGVLITSDMGSRKTKLLFVENNKNTYEFGVHFLNEAQSLWKDDPIPAALILHYSAFDYGVVGTEEQSMAFLDSDESHELEKYSRWLFDHGARLVISEEVVEREHITEAIRYIGFIHEGNVKINLYECLDAEPADIRMAKLRNLDKYNEALKLFESQDFYLARNLFSAILREVGEDQMAKWYLFECEKYLDEPMENEPLRLVMDDE